MTGFHGGVREASEQPRKENIFSTALEFMAGRENS